MNLLGISGSLRAESFNTSLLGAATRCAADAGATVNHFDIGTLPLYNQDLDGDDKPGPVAALKDAIDKADGLVLVSPEYNYGIPGVLKNAIDWASRPGYKSVLVGKPTVILSASMSVTGGVRMQAHLKNVLAATLTPVYCAPEFALGTAHKAFDDAGELADEDTRKRLDRLINGYIEWAAG
ncbi:NAD(P)H-dependent oxidoreductase [Marinihelvus fidelis]|uniref:NAD(P)H-dependent oxidoreductase n=1 Tax=Marinihelvus fidelis TaxID=2613842 RepID=A0A5N0TG86_9GAMM|nr:NADPH-dependent FMN reductase [Marinihelvus fidelis]KAA9134173.1 NAD(P)H-dependent oxidoreductase [Marinihelvus fidelis]